MNSSNVDGDGSSRSAHARQTARQRLRQRAPARHQVLVDLRAVLGPVVRRQLLVERLLGDLVLHVQRVAHREQLRLVHLLDLVRGVARFDLGPERPALDGLGEDDRRCAFVFDRGLVRREQLAVVVPAAGQRVDFVVGEVLDDLAQPRVGAEEVIADVRAVGHRVLLERAVDGGVHLVEQHAVGVALDQLVPLGTPDHLDDVPARAAEHCFEFLDDLAVATHRTVEALQVAVHDEDQIVEALARGERQRAERFGFVGLAVADEAPHLGVVGVGDLAVTQVPVEPRLVDRLQRAEAHRHRGELPEVGHQPRVWVARQAEPAQLGAEAVELRLGHAAFEIRAGVDAGRGVALEEHLVAELAVVLAAEEVVETDFVERRARRECRQVTADAFAARVGARHHHRRVPTDEGADASLDVLVAGEPRFGVAGNRVDVWRARRWPESRSATPGRARAVSSVGSGREFLPWVSTMASKLSSHSSVSEGSVSGSWWLNPSKITRSIVGAMLTGNDRATVKTVYTDGACSGNPGPGGWAWVDVDGPWASGARGAVDQSAHGSHGRTRGTASATLARSRS